MIIGKKLYWAESDIIYIKLLDLDNHFIDDPFDVLVGEKKKYEVFMAKSFKYINCILLHGFCFMYISLGCCLYVFMPQFFWTGVGVAPFSIRNVAWVCLRA